MVQKFALTIIYIYILSIFPPKTEHFYYFLSGAGVATHFSYKCGVYARKRRVLCHILCSVSVSALFALILMQISRRTAKNTAAVTENKVVGSCGGRSAQLLNSTFFQAPVEILSISRSCMLLPPLSVLI